MKLDTPTTHPNMPADTAAALRRSLPISEIFTSIQGESTHAGRLCTFVRVAGCPLRCVWCDTEYALKPKQGTPMTLVEILAEVEHQTAGTHAPATGTPALVELTGGEPLMHAAIPALAHLLLDRQFEVLCETAGAHPIAVLPAGVKRIMDIKCPDSGEDTRNHWPNLAELRPGDEVKFVVASRRDFDFAVALVRENNKIPPGVPIIVSPVAKVPNHPEIAGVSPRELADWMLEIREPRMRMQIQLHKLLWPGIERGI